MIRTKDYGLIGTWRREFGFFYGSVGQDIMGLIGVCKKTSVIPLFVLEIQLLHMPMPMPSLGPFFLLPLYDDHDARG